MLWWPIFLPCPQVDCGGVRLSGTVLETVPVLVGVNGAECGMVTLCGNILLTKGLTIEYLAQTIQGIREVSHYRAGALLVF